MNVLQYQICWDKSGIKVLQQFMAVKKDFSFEYGELHLN